MQDRQHFRTATTTRMAGAVVAAGSLLVLATGVAAAGAAPNAAPEPHKSYVCKYVDKPGENERLQTGDNPIWVDNHSLLGYDGTVTVGQEFKDKQIRSVVIVANTPKLDPEPTIKDCAPPAPPTSTTTTTSSTTTTTTTTTGTTVTFNPTTPVKTTAATLISPTTGSTTSVSTATLYPLQPVKAGVSSDGTSRPSLVSPWLASLGLVALGGLWAAFGGRLPRVTRAGRGRHEA
jgi:hypothetical protein